MYVDIEVMRSLAARRAAGTDDNESMTRNKFKQGDCAQRGGRGSGHRGAREAVGQMPDPLCAFVGQARR